MVSETWKPIPGFEGSYEASDQGRIRGVDRYVVRRDGVRQHRSGCVLSPGRGDSGHLHVNLRGTPGTKPKTLRIHQLVMWSFVGPTPDGMEVCHNNNQPEDNRLSNLRFDTHAANMADLADTGLYLDRVTHCPQGHEFTPENTGSVKGRSKNSRYCRQCKSDKWREWQNSQGPNYVREHNAATVKRNRARRAAGVIPASARHGTTGTYSNYGCRCAECTAASREYHSKRPRAPKRPKITHCPQDHEYTPENTRIKNGCRNCRKCENIRWERWRERRQAS